MLNKLGSAIKKITDKIASAIFVDKKLIEESVKGLEKALIEADVNIELVKRLTKKVKKAAEDERIKGVDKKEHIIKLLHDQLLVILGGEKKELELEEKAKQNIVMLLGLYGSGKTTTIAKLANYYSKRGKKTAMLGLDTHRPAAPEQLEQLAKKHKLKVFIDKKEKDPFKIWEKHKKQLEKFDIIFVDTAGRHTLDKELTNEMKKLDKEINPTHKILIMPADIGQGAKKITQGFQEAININGVIITRMDSSAKGGGALTACSETQAPVYFITTGEKINDIEPFNPKSFISRILGMGDLETLIEKVKSVVDEKEQEKQLKKLKEGRFTMEDFQKQLESMQNVGALGKIKELIPGLGEAKIPDEMLGTQEDKMKKWKHLINSMTPAEREEPEILEKQTSRIARIAKGAGTSTSEVRALLKQYKMLKELAKSGADIDAANLDPQSMMSNKQLMKLAKKFAKKRRI